MRFWNSLSKGARFRLIAGAAVVLSLAVGLSLWALRTPYEVLFSDLNESDAASIVEQLKRQKVSYQLAEEGTTIKVPAPAVHETRLRLMSSGAPLAGSVGFEIFDKQGLGATEQSQRVSYQRALQGELARTIGTLDDVKQARVHLVLPESTLFRRDKQEARGAVTLTLKAGASLRAEQIAGIQRLVAASVAGLTPERVVVTDQRGVTLSVAELTEGGSVASEVRLRMKRDIEDYMTRKIARLLDSAFGPGQAIVSVDAFLNFDQITRTIQDLLPVHENGGVRRRRQVLSGSPSSVDSNSEPTEGDLHGNSSSEVEYEYGRRVEQVIAAPGGVTRLSVGVIVPGDLSDDKQKRIADLVRMAAGINEARGDAIVVQPLDQLAASSATRREAIDAQQPKQISPTSPAPAARSASIRFGYHSLGWPLWGALGLALCAVVALQWKSRTAYVRKPPQLSIQAREQLLLELQRSLQESLDTREARSRS